MNYYFNVQFYTTWPSTATHTMDLLQRIAKATAPFAIGGVSGAFATVIVQPIDTLKVQVQVISEQVGKEKSKSLKITEIINKIRIEQGLKVLYRGLDSAIFRQLFYASTRLGAYELFVTKLAKYKQSKPTKIERAALSVISGAIGALVGNPFDVALIRRQASISDGRQAYNNSFQAFKSIIQTQGILGLWAGINITIMKVALINFAQLAGRDFISQSIAAHNFKEHNNLVALFVSVLAAFLSLPADNIKVKLQKQPLHDKLYNGIWDCMVKTIGKEGILRMWVGFPIYLMRGAPHSFILVRTQIFLTKKWKDSQACS